MQKYVCDVCQYVYDPENGVAPGSKWEDVPEDRTCPDCGSDKSYFSKYEE